MHTQWIHFSFSTRLGVACLARHFHLTNQRITVHARGGASSTPKRLIFKPSLLGLESLLVRLPTLPRSSSRNMLITLCKTATGTIRHIMELRVFDPALLESSAVCSSGSQGQMCRSPTQDTSMAEDAEVRRSVDADEASIHPSLSSRRCQNFSCATSAIRSPLEKLDNDYPESGMQAWSVVFGSFCAMMAGFGYMNTIGVYHAYLSDNHLQSYSEQAIGWIFSLYVCLSFLCGVQVGPSFDAYGPRWITFAGSVFLLLSVLLMGQCTGMCSVIYSSAVFLIVVPADKLLEYWQFLLSFGVLGGLGTSLTTTPAIAAIGHWFIHKRATATGIAATGGSVGGVVFPLLLRSLFPRAGWAWANRALGFIFIALLICANLLIRSRLPRKIGGRVLPDFTIFRDSAFALCTLGTCSLEFGLFVPITYLSRYRIRIFILAQTNVTD